MKIYLILMLEGYSAHLKASSELAVVIRRSRGKGQDSGTIIQKKDFVERGGTHARVVAGSVEAILQITDHLKCPGPRHPFTVLWTGICSSKGLEKQEAQS